MLAMHLLLGISLGIIGACALPILLIAIVVLLFRTRRFLRRRPQQALRAYWGRGKSVAELARRLDMPPEILAAFVPRYSIRGIPKRSGGTRRLMVPDKPTMALQRRILRLVLARLRAHPAAMAFERRRSIATHAAVHAGKAVVVTLDVVDFFTNTLAARVEAYFRRIGWNADAASLLTRLVTHENGLPQGAPTSPRLSNLVNYALDARLAGLARRRKASYSRYADDIAFSFAKDRPKRVRGIIGSVSIVLYHFGYTRHFGKKLRILRQHQQQKLTGLVVNAKPALPRQLRRKLRAARHHIATGREATLTPAQLAGYDGLDAMVRRQGAGPQ